MIANPVVPMSKRVYRFVRLDQIRVLNSRNRERVQFADNIRSIDAVGMLVPIVVNKQSFAEQGHYELVCGEGRFLAHQALQRDSIYAQVIDCDRKTALLYSLVENIARVPPNTMWFAREMKRMRDSGLTLQHIGDIVGKQDSYVAEFIRLVEMGEDRLIAGVEQGLFPMSFALIVAKASTGEIQRVLMDAFDSQMINTTNANRIRHLLELRLNRGPQPGKSKSGPRHRYTLRELAGDIAKTTAEMEGFVREGKDKENRLLCMQDCLDSLRGDVRLLELLEAASMTAPPIPTGDQTTEALRT